MNAITQKTAGDGCYSACGSAANEANDTAFAIACTLGAGDFKDRVDGIQALARRSLLSSRREPLRLYLTYAPEALAEVQELVAKEADCCAFLDFDLRHDADRVDLTITVPAAAMMAADGLFAHFAPELARSTA